jgi:Tfp pilus assembly protein PilZ
MHFDGTVLYNRAAIMEWMPYIREASAFIGKGKPIKIGGMALQIVHFMHKSKEMKLYCDELRRKQTDGRSNNGTRY